MASTVWLITVAFVSAQTISDGPLATLPDLHDYIIGTAQVGDAQYLFTETVTYVSADHGASGWSVENFWPAAMKLGKFSTVSTGFSSATDGTVLALGARNAIYTFNQTTLQLMNTVFVTFTAAGNGLAYDPTNPQTSYLIGGDKLYSVNMTTGVGTDQGINGGAGSATQTLTGTAFGPNQQLYVLDALNRQVDRFDVSSGTAVADGTMAIGPSVDVNFASGLAIGPQGRIYLADNSGGGTAFDFATGASEAFAAPAYDPSHAFGSTLGGNPFINASPDGTIEVYNPAATTDAGTEGVYYLYLDSTATAIPEPASYAGLAGLLALGLAVRRRARSRRV